MLPQAAEVRSRRKRKVGRLGRMRLLHMAQVGNTAQRAGWGGAAETLSNSPLHSSPLMAFPALPQLHCRPSAQVPRPVSERWWLRPAAPLLAWCTSAEAEAAASTDADLEGGESGSGEQTLDGHWSGEAGDVEAGADAEKEVEAAAEADAGADVGVLAGSRRPLNADRQPSVQQEQQQQDQEDQEERQQQRQQLDGVRAGMPGPVQEAAGLACDAATFAVGGAVAAIGGAGAVTVEVVGAAVDAAGAAADYSRQQWERRSRQAAAAAEPPPGPEASGQGGVDCGGGGR